MCMFFWMLPYMNLFNHMAALSCTYKTYAPLTGNNETSYKNSYSGKLWSKDSTPVCCCSVTKSCLTLCDPTDCSTPGSPFLHSWSLLTFMLTESVMPSNHLILCRSLLLFPLVFPSIRVFSNESALHIRWSKYWSFSFSISPSNEYSGLICFRIDWFDLHRLYQFNPQVGMLCSCYLILRLRKLRCREIKVVYHNFSGSLVPVYLLAATLTLPSGRSLLANLESFKYF